jgi:hypothetical protein
MTEMALRSRLMESENMGDQDNGLTLQGLAQRLERLEFENAELRHKVATLEGSGTRRDEMGALRGSERHRDQAETASETGGLMSRRVLLSKAGAAAVAAVAAGTLLNPREAKAHILNPPIIPENIVTHWIEARNHEDVVPALRAVATTNGVWAESGAVDSWNLGSGPGVLGRSSSDGQAGVRGEGATGMWGSSSKTGHSGVYGQHTGSLGFGLVGDGTGAAGAGILGRNSGGDGVRGEGTNGVHGKATSGYGGLFEGGKAQLRIVPKGSAGKPTSGAHTKGEIYMDSAGTLFVCTANGTPGMWKKVTTTTA